MSTNIEAGPVRSAGRLWIFVVLAVLLTGSVVLLALPLLNGPQNPAPAASMLADYGTVPDVQLVERNGGVVRLTELRGKVWVANFIFTRCAGSCLVMSSKMERLQDTLAAHGDVMLVSFTVDPDHDTPERLSTYAKGYHAKQGKWLFLTGKADQMQTLAKESFHLAVEEGTDPKEPIIHSKRFILIDREGHIRGYYGSEEESDRAKMLADIDHLIAENAE